MKLEDRLAMSLDRFGVAERDLLGAAVSGGADSVAMLHLLANRGRVHVVHVDHGLRPDSASDARFVEDLARQQGLECTVMRADIRIGRGESVEAVAREARYHALAEAAQRLRLRWVATAHTLDDQAETVLMRALRGAGTGGLAAIAPARGAFVRPLLEMERGELRSWLEERNLEWREDPTNEDTSFERNWIRHELMPLIDRRRPGARKSLARASTLARSDERVLDALADDVFTRAQVDDAGVLFEDLDMQPAAIASRVLRKACWQLGEEPSYADVSRLLDGSRARCGALIADRLPEGLALVRDPLPVPSELILANDNGEFALTDWGIRVRVGPASPPAWSWRAQFPANGAVIRSRRPGDRVRTTGGSRKVSDVLVDAKVPRVLRDLVPIVANRAGAVAVVGHNVPAAASGMVVDVEPHEPSWSRAAVWSRATS
jgi:tRNA(Ile)-lysidine synthase